MNNLLISNVQIVDGQVVYFEWQIGSAYGRITIPANEQTSVDNADANYYKNQVSKIVDVEDCLALAK